MQVCLICLALDRRNLHTLDSRCIRLYEQITGITIVQEDLLPKFVCCQCKHYMLKYNAFKTKAVESHCILTEILNKDGVISESSIKAASLSHHKPSLACTEASDLSIDTDIKFVKVERADDSPATDIKIELESDSSDNLTTIKEEDDFVNDCDTSITTKEDFIPEASPDDDSELSDDPLSDNLIQFASNTNPDFKIKKKKIVKQEPKENDAKTSKERSKSKSLEEYYKIDRDIFTITELTEDEQIAEFQKRKETAIYKKSPYKCEHCYKGFTDNAAFHRHMEKHAESSGPLVCALCKMRYKLQRYLKRHMTTHTMKINCKKCTKFSTFYNAHKHQKYHQGERYKCVSCSKTFSHRHTFLSHVRLKHKSDGVCNYCGKSLMNKDSLRKHMKGVHGGALPPVPLDGPECARCDIRFSCLDALDTHRRVSAQHADERESTSHDKGDSTEDKKEGSTKDKKEGSTKDNKEGSSEGENKRKIYGRTKTPTPIPFRDGPKPCEQCGEQQASPQAYSLHFRAAHKGVNRTLFFKKGSSTLRTHMCEVCGARYPTEKTLRAHQYTHAASKQFKCDRCGKLFQLEGNLQYHQKRYCGDRMEHPCGVCGNTFVSKFNLQRHMVIHKGIEYKCELCDKVFYCPMNKKAHIDFTHNKRPRPQRKTRRRKMPVAVQVVKKKCKKNEHSEPGNRLEVPFSVG